MKLYLQAIEHRFLFLTLVPERTREVVTAMEDAAIKCANPIAIADLAIRHGIFPQVLSGLGEIDDPIKSPLMRTAQEQLKRHHLTHWAPRFSQLQRELDVLCAELNQARLPHIVLRGHDLAQEYYPRAETRVFGDIDLLVGAGAQDDAIALLRELGYSYVRRSHFRNAQRSRVKQIELFRTHPRSIVIDLNWGLTANGQNGGRSLEMNLVWERARTVDSYRASLSPSDALLHTIRHVTQGHDCESKVLKGCADTAMILRRKGSAIDWDYFCYQAKKAGCARSILVFADYYDRVLGHELLGQELVPCLSEIGEYRLRIERHVSANFVAARVRLREGRMRGLKQWGTACMSIWYKLWTADTLTDMCTLLRLWLLWPPADVVVLLDEERYVHPAFVRRIRLYLIFGVLYSPGFLVGVVTRVSCVLLQGWEKARLFLIAAHWCKDREPRK